MPASAPLPFLLCGMEAAFSRQLLQELLLAGQRPQLLLLPGIDQQPEPLLPLTPELARSPRPALRALASGEMPRLAWQHGLPLFALSPAGLARLPAALASLELAVAAVACFPWRIPAAWRQLPAWGFLNVHPSLLPAFRGPDPLFWTFRQGITETGVTLHLMDGGLDTGPIVDQAPLSLEPGTSWQEAEARCARLGGQLLAARLAALAGGGELQARPQPAGGHYQPAPGPEAFALDLAWPAQRAFQFMRGTAAWGRPFRLGLGREVLWLEQAINVMPAAVLPSPLVRAGNVVAIQFHPGVLQASLAPN